MIEGLCCLIPSLWLCLLVVTGARKMAVVAEKSLESAPSMPSQVLATSKLLVHC